MRKAAKNIFLGCMCLIFTMVCGMWVRSYWRTDVLFLDQHGFLWKGADGGSCEGTSVTSIHSTSGLVVIDGDAGTDPDHDYDLVLGDDYDRILGRAAGWRSYPENPSPDFDTAKEAWLNECDGLLAPPSFYVVPPYHWRVGGFGYFHGNVAEFGGMGDNDHRFVLFPHWALALVTAPFPIWALVGWRRRRRIRWRERHGLCVACGYDLRASGGRCPECGTQIAAGGKTDPAGVPGKVGPAA